MARNPVDAVSNAASSVTSGIGSAFSTAGSAIKMLAKGAMFVGGAISIGAIFYAMASPMGLAALAPHVNMGIEGFGIAFSKLSAGASAISAKLAGASVAAPVPGVG